MIEPFTTRVSVALEAADTATRRDGRAWYPRAGRLAAAMARESGYPRAAAAGVLAAASPNSGWRGNITLARRMLTERTPYGLQRDKCARMLSGAAPLQVLRGPKERPFYRAIQGDSSAVTIDRWIVRLCVADGARGVARADEFPAIDRAIRAAAKLHRMTPRTAQATAWVQVRGEAE